MKPIVLSVIFCLATIAAWSQAVITGTGDWSNPLIWSGGNIGDVVTEDVTLNNNQDVTVQPLSTYTIGNFTAQNNTVLSIISNGVLNVGDAVNSRDFTVNNGLNLTVGGVLHIHGDLIVNNNITISVTGILIIEGDVIMNNGASLSVTSGSFSVGGNFTGGNNTSISLTLPGTLDVAGDLNVGSGSTLGGNGILSVGGACAGPICSDSQLPVTLVSFTGVATAEAVHLQWATSSELNFDYFLLEKSFSGADFFEMGRVKGQGTSTELNQYELFDKELPLKTSYYRLTSVDFDGYTEVFDVIAVSGDFNKREVFVSPNPVTNSTLDVNLNFEPEQDVQISLVDLRGIQLQTMLTASRLNQVQLSLAPGVYFVIVHTSGYREVQKIFVLN